MTNRYATAFERCRLRQRAALVPFWMLGDPEPERSLGFIDQLVAGGADALELGIPFSDPVADGVVVQAATRRALNAGVTPDRALALVGRIRARHPTLPLGLLCYANLVVHRGPERFYRDCAAVGADSVLVADLPSVEVAPYAAAARAQGIAPVLVVPPNASDAALATIAREGRGYSYLSGRAGVTGNHAAMHAPSARLIAELAARGAPPALVGFGVSTPEHVRAACRAGALGVVVGSALIDGLAGPVEAHAERLAQRLAALREA